VVARVDPSRSEGGRIAQVSVRGAESRFSARATRRRLYFRDRSGFAELKGSARMISPLTGIQIGPRQLELPPPPKARSKGNRSGQIP
jgi:hypothetical protein